MIEVFKIIHNIYDAKVSPQLMLNERANTRGNNYKLLWNSLPNSVVEACSVNAFQARLDKVWSHQEVKFDFRASLTGTGNRSECI